MVSGDLGGQTLTPGIYKSLASLEITSGNLTLDAQGDGSATFVFLIGSTLITAANTQLILLNGAQSCNVIWQVGSTVSLGENSVFRGNMLVLTSVAMADGATLDGRALVLNGAVTLINNTITVPPCASLQAISFPSPGDQTYGAPPLTLSATASSGLPVSYEVISGPASVVGDQLTITGAGLVRIQATQLGDADWRIATPVVQTILVSPQGLTVTANDLSRVYGAANPALTASYSGFVNGDTVAVLTGAPDLSTSATVGSGVAGSPYPIVVTVGTLSAANYTFLLVNGRLTVTRAATVNVVSTSANPSQTGSTVTFTANLTVVAPGSGTPTGNVQFLVTGAALGAPVPLVGGVASVGTAALASGTYPVTAEYGGDANFAGATSPLIPDQVVHAGPTTVDYVLPRFPTVGAKVRIATLLANDFDPDDTISLQSVSPTSAQGGTVVVNGLWIFYTPPAGFTNADSFTYVVVDTFGFVATGNVLIPIFVDLAQLANVVATEPVGDGDFRTRFLGVPNRAYTVQFAEDLEIPNWTTLGTATAEFLGAFEFTDSPPAISPPRYYRSTYP